MLSETWFWITMFFFALVLYTILVLLAHAIFCACSRRKIGDTAITDTLLYICGIGLPVPYSIYMVDVLDSPELSTFAHMSLYVLIALAVHNMLSAVFSILPLLLKLPYNQRSGFYYFVAGNTLWLAVLFFFRFIRAVF